MTKEIYLDELSKALKARGVKDIDDIIEDYAEHFEFKKTEGKTEDEISRKLGSPETIAAEYASSDAGEKSGGKGLRLAGVTALSIPLSLVYVLFWLCVVTLAAFSVANAVTGICLVTTLNPADVIPEMPYRSALFVGLACFGLSALSVIGAIYLGLYLKQWLKSYVRRCTKIVEGKPCPSGTLQPAISTKLAFRLKLIAVFALVLFIAGLMIGYFSMCASAGSFEPWHVWKWFEK